MKVTMKAERLAVEQFAMPAAFLEGGAAPCFSCTYIQQNGVQIHPLSEIEECKSYAFFSSRMSVHNVYLAEGHA